MGAKAEQRVARLMSQIRGRGMLALSDAADMFAVSEMTVRRDIAGSDGRLAVLGGHVVAVTGAEMPYVLDREQDIHLPDKLAACAHALPLIEQDDTIFIDSGTTTCHIAAALPADANLTVVCFSLNVANILARMGSVRWILAGGHFQASTASFSGPHGAAVLQDIRINKAFLSAGGVHPRLGVSCANFSEIGIKRAVLDNAAERYLVVDGSKFDKVKAAYFAACAEFNAIITERGPVLREAGAGRD